MKRLIPSPKRVVQPAHATLFRESAAAFRGVAALGAARVGTRAPFGAMTLLLATIVAGLIAFVVCGEYARKETVNGYLEPDHGVIRVFPPRAGVIESVRVSDGDS